MQLSQKKLDQAYCYEDKAIACRKKGDLDGEMENLKSAYNIYHEAVKSRLFFIPTYAYEDVLEDLGDLHRKMKNYTEAIDMYKRAFESPHRWSSKLGDLYYQDLRDFEKALNIYMQDIGNPHAEFQLGMMSWNGEGVNSNVVDALKWFYLALMDSSSSSRKIFSKINETTIKLKLEMNAKQMEDAKELAARELNRRREEKERKNPNPWKNVGI